MYFCGIPKFFMPMPFIFLAWCTSANAQDIAETPLELLPAELYGQVDITELQLSSGSSIKGRNQPQVQHRWISVGNIDDRHKYRTISDSVGRLQVLLKSKSSGKKGFLSCTATLIGGKYIITSNHCLPTKNKNFQILEGSVLFGYFSTEDEETAEKIGVDIVPVERNEHLDYVIFRIERSPAQFASADLSIYRTPIRGEHVYILHHPNTGPQVISNHLLYCKIENNSTVKTIVYHRCETMVGSSGALILAESDNAILGIHFGASSNKYTDNQALNQATNISKIVSESRLLQTLFNSSNINDNQDNKPEEKYTFILAVGESDRLFSSRFDSYEEMNSEGCENAQSIALSKLKKNCSSSEHGTITSFETKQCSHSGKRVRTYVVKLEGKCTY